MLMPAPAHRDHDAQAMAAAAAEHLGCSPEEVLVSSTGVIGVPLPMSKINEGIGSAVSELSEAEALMQRSDHDYRYFSQRVCR